MKGKRIQKAVVTGRFTLPAAFLLSVVFWVLAGTLVSLGAEEPFVDYPLWRAFSNLPLTAAVNALCSFLIYAVIGYLLILLNNTHAIIRMRASVQTALYCMLISAFPGLPHRLHVGCLVVFALLAALHLLFSSYQKERSEGDVFHAFLFIGIGSLLFPQLTWFVPVFWWGTYLFRSLTWRSFTASWLGLMLPYALLCAYAYLVSDIGLFLLPLREVITVRPLFEGLTPSLAATLVYLFVLLTGSFVHYLAAGLDDKTRIRCYLQFLILLSYCLGAYILLQPTPGVLLLPVMLVGISFLVGHLFVLTDSVGSNVFFVLMLVGLAALYGLNLWWLS